MLESRRSNQEAGGPHQRAADGRRRGAGAGETGDGRAAHRGQHSRPQAGGAGSRPRGEDLRDRGGRAEIAQPGRLLQDRQRIPDPTWYTKGKVVPPGKAQSARHPLARPEHQGLRHSRHQRSVLHRPQCVARLHPDAQSRRGSSCSTWSRSAMRWNCTPSARRNWTRSSAPVPVAHGGIARPVGKGGSSMDNVLGCVLMAAITFPVSFWWRGAACAE